MADQIGFIGLGNLGLPVATNILNAGYNLRVYNRTASKAAPLVANGAEQVDTPAGVATSGGVVITLLWDDLALESVVKSEGFLENLGENGIHISMSTISPETSRNLSKIHEEYGSTLIEAPIFGVDTAAIHHQLSISLAGQEQAKARVKPILKALGGLNIFDFGEKIGSALQVKLVGNFMGASAMFTMREALKMVEKDGGDPEAVINMLTQTLFDAPLYKNYGQVIAKNEGFPATQSDLPLKDVNIFKKNAQQSGAPVPISTLLYDLLEDEKDNS